MPAHTLWRILQNSTSDVSPGRSRGAILCRMLLATCASFGAPESGAWRAAPGRLTTRWAAQVSPDRVWPEYPRPTMVRSDWMSLNGLWDWAVVATNAPKPDRWSGQILVPFPIESALSGVGRVLQPSERLWYRRSFRIPDSWAGRRVLLHFGAVDWEATVWVNGRLLGQHRGGYDAFSFDITDALGDAKDHEIVVAVWDPTDTGFQPRGKQVLEPRGIWYTSVSGIWQTPWLEPVPSTFIERVLVTPSVDEQTLTVECDSHPGLCPVGPAPLRIEVTVLDAGRPVARGEGPADHPVTVRVSRPKLWSPATPHLYDLDIALCCGTTVVDRVQSYAGFRKIAVAPDSRGTLRILLNDRPLFQFGPLDQGWWPDGLYTAPTDEALRYDIELVRLYGMNMIRKHVKVEPERWYSWCDRLGVLVWQDMPNANAGRGNRDERSSDEAAANFERELTALVTGRYNHPCIVMWIPFNEGWGQHETARYVARIRKLDPTRLVNEASGWHDRGQGDVKDIHSYPGPAVPAPDPKRALVLGEFGGLGLPVRGHTWQDEKNWGYRTFADTESLTEAFLDLLTRLHPLTGVPGLCGAVYTQTTDVEIEVNGLVTYDREVMKVVPGEVSNAVQRLYTPPPPRTSHGKRLVPPAVPLVLHDPYFSIWSAADELPEADTTHWTGHPHRLTVLARVDGRTYRLVGGSPHRIPPARQVALQVLPTTTRAEFDVEGVRVELAFVTPVLPEDLSILSRPVTYVVWTARSTDRREHEIAFYIDANGELAVNEPRQDVVWQVEEIPGLVAVRVGSRDQPILVRRGDDVRIDWGYFYLAAPTGAHVAVGAPLPMRNEFARLGVWTSATLHATEPQPAQTAPVGALRLGPQQIRPSTPARAWAMVAYDDIYSIRYMRTDLRPYWRKDGWDARDLLQAAARDATNLWQRCEAFDRELMQDLERIGGVRYAQIAALAYRTCLAAGKFVADAHGQPIQFCKENHSNGCIGTADVFYPMSPQFFLFGSSMARSFLVPFMNYATSPNWRFPFAPHDLGQYPHANGQRYGGGETSEANQMPVEESGNLLLLMAAVAELEGHADFAARWRPQLERWAAYLLDKGYDPEHQLCTDDFAGHLAHNVNLSAKAILALGAYARLCEQWGDTDQARRFRIKAEEFAARWVREADDGDHYRLAFDKPGTWSQKYNLVWDRLLDLRLFPPEVARKEMAFYQRVQNRYGLPLDSRADYTKLDWIFWTATLTGDRRDFRALTDPVFLFLNETPDRSPLTDWYWATTGRKRGFTARPVVGAVFLPMLFDRTCWKKWASRDRTRADHYAPLPVVETRTILPTAETSPATWRYSLQRPPDNWTHPEFDDAAWQEGLAGFGTSGTPGAIVQTVWNSRDIWLRRTVDLPAQADLIPWLRIHHDEDAEVYLNGKLVTTLKGYTVGYEEIPLPPEAQRILQQGGRIVLAVHCRQTAGGQYIDLGVVGIRTGPSSSSPARAPAP